MGIEVIYTARKLGNESKEYQPTGLLGLHVSEAWGGGNGSIDAPKLLNITIKNEAATDFSGVVHIELAKERKEPRFYLPGFMYGWNRGEAPLNIIRQFPRIRLDGGPKPVSTWWMVRGDRLSNPVAIMYDDNRITGMYAAPYWIEKDGVKKPYEAQGIGMEKAFYQYAGYTCSCDRKISAIDRATATDRATTTDRATATDRATTTDKKYATVGYTLGYENAPWLFVQSASVYDRAELTDENCFVIKAGESIEVNMVVYDYEAASLTEVYRILEKEYTRYHQSPRTIEGMSIKKATEEIAGAIQEAAWLPEEKCYSGFVYDKPEGYTYNKLGSLTWTNGLSVAVPMLLAGIRLKDEKMHSCALTCIQNIMDNSWNEKSGFPYDAVQDNHWNLKGWWYDGMYVGGHSGYLMGQAMYYFMKAYYYEKEYKECVHEDWLKKVTAVIDKMEKIKNADYEYPYVISKDTGAGIAYDSFGSTWCLAAVAYYSWLTGDRQYLDGLQKSEQHYYDAYVAKAECYGGPLDIDKAVDSEGILAYIRAVRYLHEITQEEKYLAHMKDAISYECSFKFAYNSPVKVLPLSKIGWSSSGGSVTSTANPHIHPMSNTVVDELAYYVNQTNDEYVRNRMLDTVMWGCQTYNTYDKEYGYGKKGWMSERFCYSQGLVVEKYPDGTPAGTWFALMPWAGASILEGMVGEYWK